LGGGQPPRFTGEAGQNFLVIVVPFRQCDAPPLFLTTAPRLSLRHMPATTTLFAPTSGAHRGGQRLHRARRHGVVAGRDANLLLQRGELTEYVRMRLCTP
jgi:hypothetical protein